ncbi:Fc receptor-like A [Polypterus senegalus]|uniref:Fc receptor-like A n=1 Tax=Polypterus senegalus TaxID=55291 RepID=UPI0019669242|nr:Fc receptor-like A [Polypterus senegalus]
MRLRGQKAESLSSCLRETEQCTIKNAAQTDSGVYWCESGQKRSNSITLFVSGGHTVLQAPPQPVIEGDALILKCRYWWSGYKATFYKDNALFSSLTNEEPTINNVSKRNEGTYKCQINGYNSPELMVSVRRLFSRLSLKASPALKVQVGQILNLTCEALVNKKERVKLMYTFMKDNVTVTNSDSAVHSIMTANRSHTGAYRCIVRSVTGVTKESESIIIVVEGSSMMIIMVAVFCSVFFILLVILIVTFYHISKKKGLLCFQDKTRISTDQHHAYPECIDLPGQTQEGPPTSTKDDAIYTEISPSPEDQGVDDADPVDEVLYSDLDLKTLKKNKKDWNTLGMKNEVIYSEVNSKFSKTSTLKMKTDLNASER